MLVLRPPAPLPTADARALRTAATAEPPTSVRAAKAMAPRGTALLAAATALACGRTAVATMDPQLPPSVRAAASLLNGRSLTCGINWIANDCAPGASVNPAISPSTCSRIGGLSGTGARARWRETAGSNLKTALRAPHSRGAIVAQQPAACSPEEFAPACACARRTWSRRRAGFAYITDMTLYDTVAGTPFSTSNASASNASYTVPLPTDSVSGLSAAALQYAAVVANLNLRRARLVCALPPVCPRERA